MVFEDYQDFASTGWGSYLFPRVASCCRSPHSRKNYCRRRVLIATLVLISSSSSLWMTRVKAESSTISSRRSDDPSTIIPFEELDGFFSSRAKPPSSRSPTNPKRAATVASTNFEERVSRYREEQSRFSPVFSRWGESTTNNDTRMQLEDSMPFSEQRGEYEDNGPIDLEEREEEERRGDNGFNSMLRGKIRGIRKFLGPKSQRFAQDDDGLLPLAYRYYGRKFARPPSAGSIPIILFGPNADHWKVRGQQLQQKGFSVIACERVIEVGRYRALDTETNVRLIVNLLDALRWQNALLVACDNESVGAIQVAMQLAPERIAGLVLCGNLVESTVFATSQLERSPGLFGLDAFLQQHLPCPFTIVWDGDFSEAEAVSSMTSDSSIVPELEASLLQNRSLLLGGGMAPHRRRPEQLAWIIARFVELKLAQKKVKRTPLTTAKSHSQETEEKKKVPFGLSAFFSQESMVVVGRIFATAIAYGAVIKVGLYQYESFRSGIFDFQTKLHDILYTPEKLASIVVAFFRWIPRAVNQLFESKETTAMDDSKEQAKPQAKTQVHSEASETDQETNEVEAEEETTDLVQNDSNSCDDGHVFAPNATDTNEYDQTDESEEDESDESAEIPMNEENGNYAPLFLLDNVIV